MIGLCVVSHGSLADELLKTAKQIVGEVPRACAVSISAQDPMDKIPEQLGLALDSVDDGDGVLVLTDLLGGTPCNQALLLCPRRRMEVLTGVNLPMVLKAHSLRSELLDLSKLAQELVRYGQKHILCASAVLSAPRPNV